MTAALPRRFLALLALLLAVVAQPAAARDVTDSAGRRVTVPDHIARVFAAGPPASTLLYVVAPDRMTGWVRAPKPSEKPFLLPAVRDLPELGRLTGRGDTVNLERLLAEKPDIILDFGTVNDTYKSLADRVQAQTGIPTILIDGRFENTAAALRLVGDILGVPERGAALAAYAENTFARVDATLAKVPADKRPRLYLARGADGLETGVAGSINTEILERVGGINVVRGLTDKGGLANVSPEQVLAFAPDVIVTLDAGFAAAVGGRSEWAAVPAVKAKRVYLAPSAPFGFIDTPPSVNRLIGLVWLTRLLYPSDGGDLRTDVRAFYRLFYQTDPSDADLAKLLTGSGAE
jgi:iron complex transport system substrate-binding protein